MQSTIHTGGPSIPGSGLIDADMVLETGTDVVGHINGGHTALPDDQIICICEGCQAALEIVHNGNERAALLTLNTARQRKLDTGLIEAGKAADFVIMDQAQHAPGKNLLESVQQGNLPGVGMMVIDGIVRSQRSRNTPPATRLPELVKGTVGA